MVREPLLFGARSKGCKTLLLTDLAVAVASGTKWMNTFEVLKRRKVLFITGEANYRRISKHLLQACQRRGLTLEDLKGFLRVEAIEFPCLPSLDDQGAIRNDVATHGTELLICDPLYRGLTGVDASRLSEMGHAIKSFQAACAPACLPSHQSPCGQSGCKGLRASATTGRHDRGGYPTIRHCTHDTDIAVRRSGISVEPPVLTHAIRGRCLRSNNEEEPSTSAAMNLIQTGILNVC